MAEKVTMEITNDKLEAAIKEYAGERTNEKLSEILNLMRPTKLYVPAMLKGPDQPIPCFLKNSKEEQFLVVYTSKTQIPEEPKSQALMSMPFPVCNSIVAKQELNLTGMVINPFSDNLILKRELVEKLHEADEKAVKTRQVQMTPAQFQIFVKQQVEFGILPKRLFSEGEEFVSSLCEKKETLINEIFAEACKEPKFYGYSEKDYEVMALDIAEDLTVIRVDLPEKGIVPPLCYRIYLTFNPQTKKAGYYMIEMGKEKNSRLLGELGADGKHVAHGEAPVEGAELQKIIDLARGVGAEIVS